MDYKEKYEQALAHAREIHRNEEGKRKDMESLFPELAESEDEKIRKMLIKFFSNGVEYNSSTNGIYDKDIVAWLKKQGKQEQDPCEHCKDICLNCHNFPCIDKRAYEQGKSVWEVINEEKVNNGNEVVVEPKFKVGDWITNGMCTWKIKFIEDGLYYQTYGYLECGGDIESIDKEYHLWTIKDAKDGDVLKEDSCIFIIEKMNPNGAATVHCCLFDDGELDLTGSTLGFDVDSTHPATKEQHDLLFQKMKETGYEWDPEKKELREIKSKFKVGDVIEFTGPGHNRYIIQEIHGTSHYINSDGQRMDMSYTDASFNLIKNAPTDEEMKEALRTEYEKGRADAFAEMQKSWSEEDEVKIGETKIYLEDDGGEPPYDCKQWLDLSCTEYEIPKNLFKDGDNVEILIRKA